MKAKLKMRHALSVVLLINLLAGCSSGSSDSGASPAAGAGKTEEHHEPVTLMLHPGQLITPEDLELMINEPLHRKYPYITVEVIDRTKNDLQNHVASGSQLDLITTWNGSMSAAMDLKVFEDLAPLAKANGFDLSRFDQQALETIKNISNDGKLYGLPYNRQFNALYYNKDIFDKFGVEYPKDGMTWEDVIQLSKKLTRTENGVAYRGLDPESIQRLSFPLSLNIVDASTHKTTISANYETYKKLFELGKDVYALPENKPPKWGTSTYDSFIKDKTVAMTATVNMFPYIAQAPEYNWDVVQYPSYKDKPNVAGMYDLHIMSISKTSQHKEEAMKVLEVLFSDEVQMIATKKTGRISLLNDPKFQQAYGADMPILKGKHLEGIFKSKPASAPRLSIFYSKASSILESHFRKYVDGAKDTNTALRDAEEEINNYVRSQTGN
ncbi:ABC transporter substrate-binding protein [Paenibacillus sp. UNC451MF]|uniref:ABC transporter substrate-binding protein n=1 Tax=Paenibacillus sp. UNC451MF TaxID=1449063 RepID=UPI00048A588F|nr:extracellular solute-binding protein [Paenibacillus sp. UNC451MF]